ncbi:MAG: cytochrome c oxidase accessory protein CcoG [Verrucomicrobia bacterium]|nr:MAG: cytochrome c oxidase accessory protein CcoG [Verrucomicrobiota bacterium]
MAAQPKIPTRESVTTINTDGSHRILHPADVRGVFTRWRRIAAVVLIGFYTLLPWIPIGGHPAVFLDVRELQFHFFGLTFAAQDLWLAFFLISGLGFGLFYATALLGRVWCGWACPQTVLLEHVYRRIERFLEGDAQKQRRLDREPWDRNKLLRRGTKHFLFVLVSLAITHLFLAYFISIPEVWRIMTQTPGQNWGIFVFVVIATTALYLNFYWFREQLCIVICPYGRLQSALIDDNSMVIGYDEDRGEPRGRVGAEGAGDCIACNRCVQVCPTGIDIRQGLQMECIGCANCVDACDEIMDKVKRPRGLVRYDSFNGLSGGKTKILRPRIILYTILLLIGATVMLFSFSRLKPVSASAFRMQGAPYFVDDRLIRNQYLIRVVNKRSIPMQFTVVPEADASGLNWSGFEGAVEVGPNSEEVRLFVTTVRREDYTGPFHLVLHVKGEPGGVEIDRPVEFLGPDPKLLHD